MPAVSTKRSVLAFVLDDFVDGVAGGSGDGGDDGAGGSGECVEQGGFADVGAADDGDGGFVLFEFAVGAELARRWVLAILVARTA